VFERRVREKVHVYCAIGSEILRKAVLRTAGLYTIYIHLNNTNMYLYQQSSNMEKSNVMIIT